MNPGWFSKGVSGAVFAAGVNGIAYRGIFNLPIDFDPRLLPIGFCEVEAHDACPFGRRGLGDFVERAARLAAEF
jgi:hypothetical protein